MVDQVSFGAVRRAGRQRRAAWPALAALVLMVATPAWAGCSPGPATPLRVAAVAGPTELVADDGRTIRLALLDVPAMDGSGAPPFAQHAAALLREKALGRPLTVKTLRSAPDRHGRLVALVETPDDGTLQSLLLRAGLARVMPRIAEEGCAPGLYPHEAAARADRLGLWALAPFAVRAADDPTAFRGDTARFTVAEGRVIDTGRTRSRLYLNFGRFWREDVTVAIPVRAERRFAEAGIDLAGLAGARVRVRGFVTLRDGPLFEIDRPGAMEILERP